MCNLPLTLVRSLVIDELEARFQNQRVGIAYFYFDYANQDQETTKVVISSLLKQVSSCVSLTPELVALYSSLKPKSKRPDMSQLVENIVAAATYLSSAFIVLDALDDCLDDELSVLLDTLEELGRHSFRIFVTSRPHLSVQSNFFLPPTVTIPIIADPADVRKFLTQKVKKRSHLNQKIIDVLTARSKGLYTASFFSSTDVQIFIARCASELSSRVQIS